MRSAPSGITPTHETVIADLVPLAQALAVVAGGTRNAVDLAVQILTTGQAALGRPREDRAHHVLERARRAGVINADGTPNVSAAAELVRVCDIIGRLAPAPEPQPLEADLVFTAPPGVPIDPVQRLDLLVADVVRMSTTSLHIGGPFWNKEGFALLDPVVKPALEQRGVELDLWLHTSDDTHIDAPREWARRLRSHGTVREHWYVSDGVSLMHAKFVVADAARGYLGTANFTSLGMTAHVEIGTELTPHQCRQLVDFLMQLEQNDRFRTLPQV